MIDSIYKGKFGKEVQDLPDILDLRASNLAGDLTTTEKDGIKNKLSIASGATPVTKAFTYTGGVQEFIVDTSIIKPDYILVGNTSLQLTQFTWSGSTFTITDTLTVGAVIEIGYWDATATIPVGIEEAPVDGLPYSRKDAGWFPAATGGSEIHFETTAIIESPIEGATFVVGESVTINASGTIKSLSQIQKQVLYQGGTFAELKDYITKNKIVRLGSGIWDLTSTITIPEGTKIQGIPGKTIFRVTEGIIGLYILNKNTTIEGIEFQAISGTVYTLANKTEAKTRTGIGNTTAISTASNGTKALVSNCSFTGFNKAGVWLSAGIQLKENPRVQNCYFTNCYIGLWVGETAEYSQYSSITTDSCQVGLFIDAANTLGSLIHSTSCIYGVIVSGFGNANQGHGSISASTFNHCVTGIYVVDLISGFVFTGCQLQVSAMIVENSEGVLFSNADVGGDININKGSGTFAGLTMIHNNIFRAGSNITLTGVPLASLKNNLYMSGSDSTSINN